MVLAHLDSGIWNTGIKKYMYYSTLFCDDGQHFSAFFSLHVDMVFEYSRDNRICDVNKDLFSIVDS